MRLLVVELTRAKALIVSQKAANGVVEKNQRDVPAIFLPEATTGQIRPQYFDWWLDQHLWVIVLSPFMLCCFAIVVSPL